MRIFEFQDFDKVVLVLDDEGFKPSSPLPSPTLIIRKENRSEFEKIFKDGDKRYPIHISKELDSSFHDNQSPTESYGK